MGGVCCIGWYGFLFDSGVVCLVWVCVCYVVSGVYGGCGVGVC